MDKRLEAFQRLLNIMDDLRAQCPWDKKQTMQSLRHLTIEETYELGDAILDNDLQEVKKRAWRPIATHCFLCQNRQRDWRFRYC